MMSLSFVKKNFSSNHSERQNLNHFVSEKGVNLNKFIKNHFPEVDLTKSLTARKISEINYAMTKESFDISKQALIKTVEEYHQLFLPNEIATMILECRPKTLQGKLGHLFEEGCQDSVPLLKSNLIAFLSTQGSISIFNPSDDQKAPYTLPMAEKLTTIEKLTPLPNNQLGAVDKNNLFIWDLNRPKTPPAILKLPLPLVPDSLVSISKRHIALITLDPSRKCIVYILDLNNRLNPPAVLPKPYASYPRISSKFRHDGYFSLFPNRTQIELWSLKNLDKPLATIKAPPLARPFIQLEDENLFASVITSNHLANRIAIWGVTNPEKPLYSFPVHVIQSNLIQLKHDSPFNGCIAQCSVDHTQNEVISIWKVGGTEKPAFTFKVDRNHDLYSHLHLMELSNGTLLAASCSHIYMWNLNHPSDPPTIFDVSATIPYMAQSHTPYQPIERADGSLFVLQKRKAFTIV